MSNRLEADTKLLSLARDALSLDPMDRDVLGPVQSEIKDLREACSLVFNKSRTRRAFARDATGRCRFDPLR